jgi:hypothetical protein
VRFGRVASALTGTPSGKRSALPLLINPYHNSSGCERLQIITLSILTKASFQHREILLSSRCRRLRRPQHRRPAASPVTSSNLNYHMLSNAVPNAQQRSTALGNVKKTTGRTTNASVLSKPPHVNIPLLSTILNSLQDDTIRALVRSIKSSVSLTATIYTNFRRLRLSLNRSVASE